MGRKGICGGGWYGVSWTWYGFPVGIAGYGFLPVDFWYGFVTGLSIGANPGCGVASRAGYGYPAPGSGVGSGKASGVNAGDAAGLAAESVPVPDW